MDGYLLDTQTWRYWFDTESSKNAAVSAAANRLPSDSVLYVSAITVGEIEYGHRLNPAGAGSKRAEFLRHLQPFLPQSIEVSLHTSDAYGHFRAHLAQKYPPAGGWSNKRRAEQMFDPVSGRELGIDENDLWLVAQAVERGLVFVSTDKMTKIRTAVIEVFPDFRVEDWSS